MVLPTNATPQEFGEALQGARTAAGVPLEAIAERTKISIHALRALESGNFSRLPDRVFARMFLRQYLELIEAPQQAWLAAFDAAWQRFLDSSQPFFVRPAAPVRRRKVGPWVVGSAIVAAGFVSVVLIERGQRGSGPQRVIRIPATTPAAPAPAAVPAQPTAAPTAAPVAPGTLIVRAGKEECWVEVRVSGEKAASRLLAPGTVWEVPAGGKDVDLTLGNAGSAAVEYMGEVRSPAGPEGEVARIHLSGQRTAGGP